MFGQAPPVWLKPRQKVQQHRVLEEQDEGWDPVSAGGEEDQTRLLSPDTQASTKTGKRNSQEPPA